MRHEDIPITLTLDKLETIKKHSLALHILLGRNVVKDHAIKDGDQIKVSWTLVCDYLSDTAEKLEALNDIVLDPDVVVDAACTPLEEGKVLIYEVLHNMKKLIKKIRKREEYRRSL